ncbi:unnamed protein product [Closterium sp. NIES-64]|nr:unnamed protein product [Closterium sp. NIES-64]
MPQLIVHPFDDFPPLIAAAASCAAGFSAGGLRESLSACYIPLLSSLFYTFPGDSLPPAPRFSLPLRLTSLLQTPVSPPVSLASCPAASPSAAK